MEPRSPTLQADSLPSEPPGKPISFYSGYEMFLTNLLYGRDKLESKKVFKLPPEKAAEKEEKGNDEVRK